MIIYPQILFLTNKDDFATDYLIYRLKATDIPYLRINSDDITNFSVKYKIPQNIEISFDNIDYCLTKVKSIYFRRAPTVFPDSSDPINVNYINRERKEFFEGLYLSLDVKWINPIFKTYVAERKLYQLHIANRLGLKTPRTVVSNDPSFLSSEALKKNIKCIIKPITHGLQITKNGAYSIYTSEITDIEPFHKNVLFESPVMIQEKIENYRDIRITVIGKNIFPVEILKKESLELDWRKPDIEKEYRLHSISNELKSKILEYNSYFDLIYSAIDFILTPSGEYIFLEINPAGEWVWLEKELNLPLSESIINELLNIN